MSDTDRILCENANRYRIHQDTLRWSLAAGYAGSLAATLVALPTMEQNSTGLPVLISTGLFVFGHVYLVVLGVENWFYNLFAKYVAECEQKLADGGKLEPLSKFTEKNREAISPLHPSFSFVLLLAVFGNCVFLVKAMRPVLLLLCPCMLPLAALRVSLLVAALYSAICALSVRRWNAMVYKPLIEPMQSLYNSSLDK